MAQSKLNPGTKAAFDPSTHQLTKRQATRLAAASGLPADKLAGLTVADIGERFRFQIDPLQLLFRKVCGQVVKTDPATGIAYPVPYATVQVEDTDCSLLGYFPSASPWAWYFPFSCHREVIASTRTDACGNFCVWVPRWDIDWVLRWRAERVCFPIIFERPSLRDLIEALNPQPLPPHPDPGDPLRPLGPFDPLGPVERATALTRLTHALGEPTVKRLLALDANAGFGADATALQNALAAPGFGSELAPPLPAELKLTLVHGARDAKASGANAAVQSLAARLRLDATQLKGLDLRRYIGPFKRCYTRLVPEWTPIIDVPDITFRVTQDTNGDGVEEQIYGESYFQVRWDATSIGPLTLQAGPQARAGVLCGPDHVPCGDTPAIVLAGRLPVAGDATLYDPVQGYSVRTNRPHPTQLFNDPLPNPDAESPFMNVLSLYGCNKTDKSASKYRIVFEFSSNQGASWSAPTPFVGLTWPLNRLDGSGHLEWHYPAADADGWYPITLPAGNPFMPQDLLLDWPTTNFANGRYRLTLQLGNGGSSVSSQAAPVVFNVDNSAPSGVFNVEWSFTSAGPWQPLGGVCPVVRRGTTPADVYFRVTMGAAATHLRAVQMWPSSCGSGSFSFVSGSGGVQPVAGSLVYEHWHTSVADNDQTLQVIYQLPGGSTAEGTYGFGACVSSRAFNPSGGDGGQLATPAWQYDPAPVAIWPSVAFSVINAAP
jgi:hypothetical protein